MGTDIGVVTIEHLERPDEPVYGFIQELPSLLDSDNSSWSGAWEGNFFLQTDRQRLLAASRYYAGQHRLSTHEREELAEWVNSALPWKGDVVMLHLDW